MQRRLLSHFGRARHLLLALALALLALLPSLAFAQSGCTAMWGLASTGGVFRLAYFNGSAGTAAKFTTLSFVLPGNPNALAGDPSTGSLYYFNRANTTTYSINVNTHATATVGTITPVAPTTGRNGNIIGAVIDQNSNLIYMASDGNTTGWYSLAIVSKTGNTTNAKWTSVTYAIGGGRISTGGSGDIYLDKNNQIWMLTNTATPGPALYPLTLTIVNGSITSALAGASVTYNAGAVAVAGVSVLPTTGDSYLGAATNNQIAYQFQTGTPNSQVLADASGTATYIITDMGNCVLTPAAPTISKTISPSYAALGSPNTATLVVAISNSNTAPIWLTQTLTDTFPAGLTVAPVPNLTTGACAASTTVTNVITATAGASTFTYARGGRIPAGGCTITFSVRGPPSGGAYTNTIAAGALMTTSGVNATAASATYKVGTDFAAGKSQCVGVCGTTSTGVVTIGGGQTVQYVLTVTNSASGGTGSVTFTDTLPTLMTPVLSITANMVGGGACSTATSVVGGRTQVRGTVTNAPAGGACSVIVTSLVSRTQTVSTGVTNTMTLSPVASTADTSTANNTASIPTIVKASANLSVAKTDNKVSVVAGSTTSYTITVANIGPAAAPGATLFDPAVTGLSCTSVSCTSTAANMCPASPTIANLQNSAVGLQITPTFAINTTATFVVNCGVTATGLP